LEDEREMIVLYDEDDNEQEFEVLAVLDVDENRYAVLMPVSEEGEEEGNEDEAYILRVEEDEEGNDILVGLDDEEELNTVVEAYEELAEQEDN